jgi:hypothetical protein
LIGDAVIVAASDCPPTLRASVTVPLITGVSSVSRQLAPSTKSRPFNVPMSCHAPSWFVNST